VGLFAAGWGMIFASLTILYPLLPVIGADFQLGNAAQGAVTSTYFLAYVLMQVPTGLSGTATA
jgi:fucose permease